MMTMNEENMTYEAKQHILYNTEQPILRLPEYGRYVLMMVEQIKNRPSREERTRCAHKVVEVMRGLTPDWQGMDGHEQVLWDHLAYLANYDLDIEWPVVIRRMEESESVSKLAYPGNDIKYLHYGNLVEKMLIEIAQIESASEREPMLSMIAGRMKKSLGEWRGEQADIQSKIARDIAEYTNGVVGIEEVLNVLEKKQKNGRTPKRK
jgi:hypothetical protein